MGWYGASIGQYELMTHDSIFDHIKRGKPEEYYQNKTVQVEFHNVDEEEYLDFPLLKFCKLKKLKKYYDFEPTMWDDDIMTKILLEIIKERNLPIVGEISFNRYTSEKWFKYYLISEKGSDDILLSNHNPDRLFIIENYDDILWIRKNGLSFDS